jgi:hypothetical protein
MPPPPPTRPRRRLLPPGWPIPAQATQPPSRALSATSAPFSRHNLEDEERSFLPIAATPFTAEEWGELPGHVARTFTGDKLWLILGLVFEQMTDEQRVLTIAHMPPPAVEMWNGPAAASFTADVRGTGEPAPN